MSQLLDLSLLFLTAVTGSGDPSASVAAPAPTSTAATAAPEAAKPAEAQAPEGKAVEASRDGAEGVQDGRFDGFNDHDFTKEEVDKLEEFFPGELEGLTPTLTARQAKARGCSFGTVSLDSLSDDAQICVIYRRLDTRNLGLAVLYQADEDDVFRRRAALARSSKYGDHAPSKVVKPQREAAGDAPGALMAVESEIGTGTGFHVVRLELFSWDGRQLRRVLDTVKSCRNERPGSPDTRFSGTLLSNRDSMDWLALRFSYRRSFEQSSGAMAEEMTAASRAACGAKGPDPFCEESFRISGAWVDAYRWDPGKQLYVPDDERGPSNPIRQMKQLIEKACQDDQFGDGEAEPARKQ